MKPGLLAATIALAAATSLCACAPQSGTSPPDAAAASLPATNKVAGLPGNETSRKASEGGSPRLPEYVRGELLVKFRTATPAIDIATAKHGLTLKSKRVFRSVAGLQLVKIGTDVPVEEALATLRQQVDVEYAEPNYIYRKQSLPDDPSLAQQWALDNTGQTQGTADADIDAREAWDITTGSASTVVAVIDTGVDYTHPDLAPNMFTNSADCDADLVDDDANGYVDDCHGIDTASDDSDPMDTDGHGTHVAGIIAARGNNGIGVSGVAWNARVVACRFIGADGAGNAADAIACLDYVAALSAHGVNVVATNNSWGGGTASRALQDAIDRQRQRGILFVTAAGNAPSLIAEHNLGINTYEFESGGMYPCSYALPNVICVAASTHTDDLEPYSYYGINTAHIFAPGGNILSTLPGGTYGTLSGTSMAAPHVTGVIALLKSQTPTMGWLEARNRILTGGDVITRSPSRPGMGWPAISQRRLNARGAMSCLGNAITRRTMPRLLYPRDEYAVGEPMKLSVLHVSCLGPAGELAVKLNPGNVDIPLHDDGLNGDSYAGDGEYSAIWTPVVPGKLTLTFPGVVNQDAGAGLGPDDFVINAHPFLKPGFPTLALHSPGSYLNTPQTFLANLDGGADLEIVDSNVANGPTYTWKSDGTLLPGWPLDRDGRMYHIGDYSAGELDGNPDTLEIAGSAADDGTTLPTDTMKGDPLEAFSSAGQMLPGWPRASNNFLRVPPVLVDFDLDGRDEIFLGGGDGYLRGMRYNGDSVPGFEYGLQPTGSGQYVWTPLAGDLDFDGRPDLVLTGGNQTRTVFVTINGASGTAVRRERVITENYAMFGLGDVDGDGTMNLLAFHQEPIQPPPGGYPVVSVVSPEGEVLRTLRATTQPRNLAGTALADLDGDGIPEIVLTMSYMDPYWQTITQEIAVLRGDGTALPGFPVVLTAPEPVGLSGGGTSPPVVGDVDGDGQPEIVIQAGGALFAVNPDGTNAPGTPFTLPAQFRYYSGIPMTPAIGDIDGDGRNDIVMTSDQWYGRAGWLPEVFAFDLHGPANHGPIEWGQTLEGPQRRGAYITGKNLVNDAYLAIRTVGEGRVTSTAPVFQCQDHCLRRYAKNSPVRITATPTAGGSFVGWRGACAGQGASCQVSLTQFAATTAIFSTKTLDVTVNGPGSVTSDIGGIQCPDLCRGEFANSQTVTLTATPAANASFVGWSNSGVCDGAAPTCALPMTVARTVTARFEYRKQLDISVDSRSGIGSVTIEPLGETCRSSRCTYLLDYGTHVRVTANPEGSRSFRWSATCPAETAPTCEFDMTDNHFVGVQFFGVARMAVSKAGSGSGMVTSVPAGIDCGATCSAEFTEQSSVRLVATPSPDSVFTGWTGTCDGPHFGTGPGECYASAVPGFSTVAHFELRQVLQVAREGGSGTVTSDPAGLDCGNPTCTGSFAPNQIVYLTAVPAPQNSFVSWTGACQSIAINGCVITMDQAKQATARFFPWDEVVVTIQGGGRVVSNNNPGIDCPADCREKFGPADTARLVATPDPLFSFAGWSGDCQGTSNGCALDMTRSFNVTARFVPWLELVVSLDGSGTGSVNSSGPGISCGTDCREHYAPDSQVTLSATAGPGSEFTGWSGACTGNSSSCTVTMSAARTTTASFRKIPQNDPPPVLPVPGKGGGHIDWLMLALGASLLIARSRRKRVGL